MRIPAILPFLVLPHVIAENNNVYTLQDRMRSYHELDPNPSYHDSPYPIIYKRAISPPSSPRSSNTVSNSVPKGQGDSPKKSPSKGSWSPNPQTSSEGPSTRHQLNEPGSASSGPESAHESQSSRAVLPYIGGPIRRASSTKTRKGKKIQIGKHISKESIRLANEENLRKTLEMSRRRSSPPKRGSPIGNILADKGQDDFERGRNLTPKRGRSTTRYHPEIEPASSSGYKPIGPQRRKVNGARRSPSPADSLTSIKSLDSTPLTFRKLKRVQTELVRHAGRQRVYDEANDGARKTRWLKTCAHAVTATGICLNVVPHIGFKIAGGSLAVLGIAAHHKAMSYSNDLAVEHHMNTAQLSDQEAYAKGQEVLKQAIRRPSEAVKEGSQRAGETLAETATSCYGAMCEGAKGLYNSMKQCVNGVCAGVKNGLSRVDPTQAQIGLDPMPGGLGTTSSTARLTEHCVGAMCSAGQAAVGAASSGLRQSGMRAQRAPASADSNV